MYLDGDTIVHAPGPMPWHRRALWLSIGLMLVIGPGLLTGPLLTPQAPQIGLVIGAGAIIGFAILGLLALRTGLGPRHDLRLDPRTGLATLTTHRLGHSSSVQLPLAELGSPWIERVPRPDMADDFTLGIALPGHAPLTVWHLETEAEAQDWARRIEAMRNAAQ